MAAFKEYGEYDGLGLAELLANGEVTSEEIWTASAEQANRVNPTINAVVSTLGIEEYGANQVVPGPFGGVPFLLKDLSALATGSVTTFGSKLFADSVADHDSEVVARYRGAGLVVVGKTNTSEMGLTATTEPGLFGATRNPWDISRSAGGSSGGAAAAVAAGIVPCAHSTDGGGSTRIPASCCGLFGLKPTRGRIPLAPDAGERNGAFFTHHAITRTVRDSAALLDIAAGPCAGDPYWAPPFDGPLIKEVGAPTSRLRIALQTNLLDGGAIAPECREAAVAAANLCENLGHTIVEALPTYSLENIVQAARTIWSSSLAAAIESRCASLGRSPGPELVEPLTWQFYLIGRGIQAKEYVRAIDTVHREGRALAKFLQKYDLLLTPTLALPPLQLGAINPTSISSMEEADALFLMQFRSYSPFTLIANASGNPAMSVPLAWTQSGLPIGVQFLGRFGAEALLFRLAAQLEEARPWFNRRPDMSFLHGERSRI